MEVLLANNSLPQRADSALQIYIGSALHCTSATGCGNKRVYLIQIFRQTVARNM